MQFPKVKGLVMRRITRRMQPILLVLCLCNAAVHAGDGDPQVRTDHPWYPGELASSTFERLVETQAEMYERVMGERPYTNQDRALAAWMWRNIHFAHGEEGVEDLWGRGFRSSNNTTREYWTGLYAHGFGLCGTTHAQWSAELNRLLGHGHSRTVGVRGHNSFEVFLTGGEYGDGRWALLDHDISTVVMDAEGKRLLSIAEIRSDLKHLADPRYEPQRQKGWPLGGLHPDDPQSFADFQVAEQLPGYAGPPPIVHLRRGETLTRYFKPGLADGKTFVFWGRNYRTSGVPGLERSRTWVNQPEKFRENESGAGFIPGQTRYGNAIYIYRPDFGSESYREAMVSESDREVVLEFHTPYIIAATPATDADWGVYEPGCRNGLVVRGTSTARVAISVDRGGSWLAAGELRSKLHRERAGAQANRLGGELDLTDYAKGHRQYWLKFEQPASSLKSAEIEIITTCQANPAMFPRLKDGGSKVSFASSGQAVVSAGPNVAQAQQHLVGGSFNSPRATLELSTPRGEPARRLYAAAHIASSNPPDPAISYQIEYSVDGGKNWEPVVKDWLVPRLGEQPPDSWSQSLCYGDISLATAPTGPVQVRFRNDGGKQILRAEAHLAYDVARDDACLVTFAWSDSEGSDRSAQHSFRQVQPDEWSIATGKNVQMHWVEFAPVSKLR